MVICEKCGSKTVLAIGIADSFCPDEEPYENGIIEDSKQNEIEVTVYISIRYCEKCDRIISADVEPF